MKYKNIIKQHLCDLLQEKYNLTDNDLKNLLDFVSRNNASDYSLVDMYRDNSSATQTIVDAARKQNSDTIPYPAIGTEFSAPTPFPLNYQSAVGV